MKEISPHIQLGLQAYISTIRLHLSAKPPVDETLFDSIRAKTRYGLKKDLVEDGASLEQAIELLTFIEQEIYNAAIPSS